MEISSNKLKRNNSCVIMLALEWDDWNTFYS